MCEEKEHLFQQINSCQICEKLIDNDDEKVRDHCHIIGNLEEQLTGVVKSSIN